MEVAAPGPNDFERTLLGPGYGECAIIHYGHGEWIIVDSCVDEAGHPAALNYLRQIGVDAGRSVRMIVVTHWHDDHIRGIVQVVRNCPRATKEIGKTLALVKERGTTALLATPNHLSVALLVQLDGIAVLLGADVLRFNDRKKGWLRIADLQTEYDHPVAALTPFQQGGVPLPKASDISRICGRTTQAYITSLPRRARPPKRSSAVDKTIAGVLRNRRMQSPPFGRITLRYSSHDGMGWTAQLAGAACRLHPGIL